MERYYIFFRCWEHFSADFQFEQFDDRPDDEINKALEKYAVSWRRENKSEFDRLVRERSKQLVAKLEKREEQIGHHPMPSGNFPSASSRSVSSFMPRRPDRLGPGPDCSLGCRNAYGLGWITAPLPEFGGWSPSPKHFLMRVGNAELAANIVEALAKWWPASKCRIKRAHLNPRFGHVPARQFTVAEQAVIETGMDRLRAITPSDVCEELQQVAAAEAMELGRQIVRICEPEAEGPESRAAGTAGSTHDAAAKDTPDPPPTLADIPPLDKTNGEWVLAPDAAKLAGVETTTLSNDRIAEIALRDDSKCMGIDRRGRMWRKERESNQNTWYYVPSLSYKSS